MWTPPQRIKFRSAPGHVPSRDEAAASRLFSPLQTARLRLDSRVWVPAMVPWRASDDGFVTEDVLDWYGRFARGRPGAIVVEATGIRDVPSGPLLRIGHDRYLPGLRELVERVRAESDGRTRLLIQLIDFLSIRRRPEPAKFFERFLRITDAHRAALDAHGRPEEQVREALAALPRERLVQVLAPRELEALDLGARERVTDLDLPHVRELPAVLPGLFADAAVRAAQAGFDGVELHYAHAYTMASFLSATNTRDDGYGGAREQRVRLPLEVYRAVRAAVDDRMVVGCRFLADECIDGGTGVADATWFGVQFAAAGMDFLSTSRGGKFDDAKQPSIGASAYPYTGRSGYECMPSHASDEFGPFGRNAAPTRTIRSAIRAAGLATPVVCTGGVHRFEQAEAMIADGTCDVVGIARQALADPDWPRKLLLGAGASIRLCEYTNYCEGLDQKHKQVTCQLWDRKEMDQPGVRRTHDGKRRLTAPDWTPPATSG
jgi:2,4-dienoyl-CoA reductase-like NADH-dependent reductase (Old Yellow Enzyme family)